MDNVQPLYKKDPKKIGGYTLIGRLGSGGMGVVYLASKGSESVALKVVRDSLIEDDSQLARFKREIATLEPINHPNIARILDSGLDGEQAWFAAEFANGPDLSARVKDKGPLGEDEWWTLAEGLMSALAAVHAARVIHRDVKPSNVILTEAGPKLIDFGIAHVSDATSVTSTGMVAGSPVWFSPEQIEGFELTPATDVFSAGSVLTFAATGSSPWGDETTMTKASVFKILTSEPDIAAIGGVMGKFVGRLLEKEPGDRPSAQGAASAAGARNPSSLVADVNNSVESTRVSDRNTLGRVTPTFSRPPESGPARTMTDLSKAQNFSNESGLVTPTFSRPPESGPARTMTDLSKGPEFLKRKRLSARFIAAVVVPLLAVAVFLVGQQSEATGDLSAAVRVSAANPIVGTGSISLGSGGQNLVELEFGESRRQQSWPDVMRWSSWETLRVVYDPPFSEDQDYRGEINLQDLGLNGFAGNAELSYVAVLEESETLLQLVNRSSGSVLHSIRLKRGNETKSISDCAEDTSAEIERSMGAHLSLYVGYEEHRETARLVFDDDVSLLYTTWRTRIANLVALMETDAALLPATSAFAPQVEPLAIEIEEAHEDVIQSYRSHSDLAALLDRQGRSDTNEWQDSWDNINAARRQFRSAINAADSTNASQICSQQIQ